MSKLRVSDQTKYPNIFEKVYWGYNLYDPNRDDKYLDLKYADVFENRNKFVEQFNIKKAIDKFNPGIKLLLNLEFNYETLDNMKKDNLFTKTPAKIIDKFKYETLSHEFNDHIEVYETNDNKIIVLSSPYTLRNSDYELFLEKTGFIDYGKLYNSSALSFYKIYNKEETKVSYLTKKIRMILKTP